MILKTISILKKSIITPVFILLSFLSLQAQYYYKDIIGTEEINQMIKLYTVNKVLSVTVNGYDGDGVKTNDFAETHEFLANQDLLKITTRNKTSVTTQYYRFDKNGKVTNLSDTSDSVISSTSYQYDEKNNLVSIRNIVSDSEDSIFLNELHQWFYDSGGRPVKMLRIVNNKDTTEVRFTLDENGNVIEELPFKNKISREKTFYYYDPKNRLTDIVRYNVIAKRLLPDFMFEYSDKNQLIQKITTTSTRGIGYVIWRYVYDDRGLKIKEASFNRDKVMTGKIEYSYRFGE